MQGTTNRLKVMIEIIQTKETNHLAHLEQLKGSLAAHEAIVPLVFERPKVYRLDQGGVHLGELQ
jgi:hypothetical protein